MQLGKYFAGCYVKHLHNDLASTDRQTEFDTTGE